MFLQVYFRPFIGRPQLTLPFIRFVGRPPSTLKPPPLTKLFRYLKWGNPHLYKLYGYGLCKGVSPTPKIAKHKVLSETLHFRYLKFLVTRPSQRMFPSSFPTVTKGPFYQGGSGTRLYHSLRKRERIQLLAAGKTHTFFPK